MLGDTDQCLEELKPHCGAVSLQTPLGEILDENARAETDFLSSLKSLLYVGVRLEVAQLTFVRDNLAIRLPDNSVYLFDYKGRLR